MDNYPIHLGVSCCQYVKSHSRCWLSRPQLSPQIRCYTNSSRCDVVLAPIPYTGRKCLLTTNRTFVYIKLTIFLLVDWTYNRTIHFFLSSSKFMGNLCIIKWLSLKKTQKFADIAFVFITINKIGRAVC